MRPTGSIPTSNQAWGISGFKLLFKKKLTLRKGCDLAKVTELHGFGAWNIEDILYASCMLAPQREGRLLSRIPGFGLTLLMARPHPVALAGTFFPLCFFRLQGQNSFGLSGFLAMEA